MCKLRVHSHILGGHYPNEFCQTRDSPAPSAYPFGIAFSCCVVFCVCVVFVSVLG